MMTQRDGCKAFMKPGTPVDQNDNNSVVKLSSSSLLSIQVRREAVWGTEHTNTETTHPKSVERQ
jgi:hypothetical protein